MPEGKKVQKWEILDEKGWLVHRVQLHFVDRIYEHCNHICSLNCQPANNNQNSSSKMSIWILTVWTIKHSNQKISFNEDKIHTTTFENVASYPIITNILLIFIIWCLPVIKRIIICLSSGNWNWNNVLVKSCGWKLFNCTAYYPQKIVVAPLWLHFNLNLIPL